MNQDKPQSIYDYCEAKNISIRQVYDFTLFTNPLGPSQKAKHAMMKALKIVNQFPDKQTRYLRRSISKLENVPQDSIVFGRGSLSLLELFIATADFKTALIHTLDDTRFYNVLNQHKCERSFFTLNDDGYYLENDDFFINDCQRAQLLIISNPDPISGLPLSTDFVTRLADELKGTGRFLVLDERFIEYSANRRSSAIAATSDNLVVLRSFSYYHSLAGDSLGYAIGGPQFIELMSGFINPGPLSVISTVGALASLKDTGYSLRTDEFMKMEKKYLLDKLGRIPGINATSRAGNYVIIAFDKPVSDMEKHFLERRILIEPLHKIDNKAILRLPIRRHHDNARFAKTLSRLMISQQ
jgi:histidinol-phosphate/aromatic aminotransferase/cobyric acid decarboxylase-like protein